MADIDVIIRIPEEMYKWVNDANKFSNDYGTGDFIDLIKNGTPLPKPFDLEGLKKDMKALNCGYPYGLDYLLDCLKKRLGLTIIEADKEDK